MRNNPLHTQIGGDHYKKKKMQPIELICALDLNFIQGCIVKYVTRCEDKNGLEDLVKITHYAELGMFLNPANHALAYGINGFNSIFARYCEENNLNSAQSFVIYYAITQNWDSITFNTNKLIEEWNNKNR